MKQTPILFSRPMVQAIIREANPKTKTRRTSGLEVINENPDDWQFEWADFALEKPWRFTQKSSLNEKSIAERNFHQEAIKCPFGNPGDILWVRETFANGYNETLDPNIGKEEKDWTLRYWVYKDGSQLYSDGSYFPNNKQGTEPSFNGAKWKPSIHMPKAAARIWLEIVSIKVERLQDITEEDSIAEGIEVVKDVTELHDADTGEKFTGSGDIYKHYTGEDGATHCIWATNSFQSLWEKINGSESWDANPWVWVVEFKRVENPNKNIYILNK